MTFSNTARTIALLAVTTACAQAQSPSSHLTSEFSSSLSGGASLGIRVEGPPFAQSTVLLALGFFQGSPVPTPFGDVFLDLSTVIAPLSVGLDAAGSGRADIPLSPSMTDAALALQAAVVTPAGNLQLSNASACMIHMPPLPGPGPLVHSAYDASSDDWRIVVHGLRPGTVVRVTVLRLSYPQKVAIGTADNTGRADLGGTGEAPEGGWIRVEIQEPGSTSWTRLGADMPLCARR